MKTAVAWRRFILVGTLSNDSGAAERAYSRTAISAFEVADQLIFVGTMATRALRAKRPENADTTKARQILASHLRKRRPVRPGRLSD